MVHRLFYERENVEKEVPELLSVLGEYFYFSPKTNYIINKLPIDEIIKQASAQIIGSERPKLIQDYLLYKCVYLSKEQKQIEIDEQCQKMNIREQLAILNLSKSTYYYNKSKKRSIHTNNILYSLDYEILITITKCLYVGFSRRVGNELNINGYRTLLSVLNNKIIKTTGHNSNLFIPELINYFFPEYRKYLIENKIIINRKYLMKYLQGMAYSTPYPKTNILWTKENKCLLDEGYRKYIISVNALSYPQRNSLLKFCQSKNNISMGSPLIYHYKTEVLEVNSRMTNEIYLQYINNEKLQYVRNIIERLYMKKREDDLSVKNKTIYILGVLYYPKKNLKNSYIMVLQNSSDNTIVYYKYYDDLRVSLYVDGIKDFLSNNKKPDVIHLEKRIPIYNDLMCDFLTENNIECSTDDKKSPVIYSRLNGLISIIRYLIQADLIDDMSNLDDKLLNALIKQYNKDCLNNKYPILDEINNSIIPSSWDWAFHHFKKKQ